MNYTLYTNLLTCAHDFIFSCDGFARGDWRCLEGFCDGDIPDWNKLSAAVSTVARCIRILCITLRACDSHFSSLNEQY